MMSQVKNKTMRGAAALLVLAFSCLASPSGAGQAGSGFRVTIHIQPANGSCTAAIGPGGAPQVDCEATVIGGATSAPGQAPRAMEAVAGSYRIPDARMKIAGAVVELGEDNYHAWGEYSSRMILAGGIEYVEMTVTW